MSEWNDFLKNFSLDEYLANERRIQVAGEELINRKALVEQYKAQGYEVMSFKSLGGVDYRLSGGKRPVVLHVARCYAYYTTRYGEIYASCTSIPVREMECIDANSRQVYAAPTKDGDEIQFVKIYTPGSPSRLDGWTLESPTW